MYQVVICTVSSGRVERKSFDTWEAARAHVDACTEKKGQRVRVWLERVETPPSFSRNVRLDRTASRSAAA